MRIIDPRSNIAAARKLVEFIEEGERLIQETYLNPLIEKTIKEQISADQTAGAVFVNAGELPNHAMCEMEVYTGILPVFEALAKGNTASEVLGNIDFEGRETTAVSALLKKLESRQEVLVSTNGAKSVCDLNAWRDLKAITGLFVKVATKSQNCMGRIAAVDKIHSFTTEQVASYGPDMPMIRLGADYEVIPS